MQTLPYQVAHMPAVFYVMTHMYVHTSIRVWCCAGANYYSQEADKDEQSAATSLIMLDVDL